MLKEKLVSVKEYVKENKEIITAGLITAGTVAYLGLVAKNANDNRKERKEVFEIKEEELDYKTYELFQLTDSTHSWALLATTNIDGVEPDFAEIGQDIIDGKYEEH